MLATRPLHVGFMWFSCARGKRKHFNWLDGARWANGCKKFVGCLRSSFGRFGINLGSNGCPKVPFKSYNLWELRIGLTFSKKVGKIYKEAKEKALYSNWEA